MSKSYVAKSLGTGAKQFGNLVRLSALGITALGMIFTYAARPPAPDHTSYEDVAVVLLAQETGTGSAAGSGTGAQILAGVTTDSSLFTVSGAIILGDLANPNCVINNDGTTTGCSFSGGGTSTGNVLAIGDPRWVNTAGDTMTGALTINVTGGSATTVGLEVIQTMSGSRIFANNQLNSSGSLAVEGNAFLQGALTLSGNATLRGTTSGAVLHAESTLTSSGGLVWEGAASGATLVVSGQFSGVGLTDCDADNQTLSWDATAKRFGCGDDDSAGSGLDQSAADARYVNLSGDTMTGALTIAVTGGNNQTVALEIPHTMSGRVIHAQDLLTSSGALSVDGKATISNGGIVATIADAVQQVFMDITDGSYTLTFGDSSNQILAFLSDGSYDVTLGDVGNQKLAFLSDGSYDISIGDIGNQYFLNMTDGGYTVRLGAVGDQELGYFSDGGYTIKIGEIGTQILQSLTDGGYTIKLGDVGNQILADLTDGGYSIQIGDIDGQNLLAMTDGGMEITIGNIAGNTLANLTDGSMTVNIGDAGASQFLYMTDGSDTYVFDTTGLGIGTSTPETELEVVGTASGKILHGQDSITSSGSIAAEGSIYTDGVKVETGSIVPITMMIGKSNNVTATASETDFAAPFQEVIPANTIRAGDVYHVAMAGSGSSAVSDDGTFRLKIGSTTIYDSGAFEVSTTPDNFGSDGVMIIFATVGASATAYLCDESPLPSNMWTSSCFVGETFGAALESITVNTTANITLKGTFQWETNNAGNKATLNQLFVTRYRGLRTSFP